MKLQVKTFNTEADLNDFLDKHVKYAYDGTKMTQVGEIIIQNINTVMKPEGNGDENSLSFVGTVGFIVQYFVPEPNEVAGLNGWYKHLIDGAQDDLKIFADEYNSIKQTKKGGSHPTKPMSGTTEGYDPTDK